MIKIENSEVIGWEHAVRGMRNPMNSWDRSDSYPAVDCRKCGIIKKEGSCIPKDHDYSPFECYEVGPNDHELMMKLVKGGPVHAKFRRMITVYLDITAPLYWWKEFDTYKVGTAANSCSTMHKIHSKEFTIDDFSHERLFHINKEHLTKTIEILNEYREEFNKTGDEKYWWQMIQLLPSSYNQKRTVILNYEVLANIYQNRKDHKLDEWRECCKWIEELEYSEIITGKKIEN